MPHCYFFNMFISICFFDVFDFSMFSICFFFDLFFPFFFRYVSSICFPFLYIFLSFVFRFVFRVVLINYHFFSDVCFPTCVFDVFSISVFSICPICFRFFFRFFCLCDSLSVWFFVCDYYLTV